MSPVLRVRWTIVPQTAPQPWRHCRRCGGTRRFRTGGKIRLNANGKLVDAWLIYRCAACDDTWNRPILERRPLRTIDPDVLGAELQVSQSVIRRLERRGDLVVLPAGSRPHRPDFSDRPGFSDTQVSGNDGQKALPARGLNFPTGISRH